MFCLLAADSTSDLFYFSWDEVLSPNVFVFYAAYIVAFCFTPIMRRIAVFYGIVDQPDGIRKMHTRAVAYLGGLAVFLGWLAGLTMSQFVRMHHLDALKKLGIITPDSAAYLVIPFSLVVAAFAIILLGLWDDILHMSPWKKLLGQIAAGVLLVAGGIGERTAAAILDPLMIRLAKFGLPGVAPSWLIAVSSACMVIGLVVICCNATNLMDGLDGLCGGVTAIVAAGFLFLAVSLAMTSGTVDANTDAMRVVIALALLGAVLGFVPFNFNPASIFMGDTGSMFLGFTCAVLMILFADSGHFKWLIGSLVMFSLPLLDTGLAFTRRWVNGRPLFSADRFHFHHQLVGRGFTVRQTVIISYALAVIFCILGAAVVFIRARYAVGVWLVIFGSIIVAAYKMGMVHERVDIVKRRPLATEDVKVGPAEPGAFLEVSEESPDPAGVEAPIAQGSYSVDSKTSQATTHT